MNRIAMQHAQGAPPRHSADYAVEPVDLRNPGAVFLQQEITSDRRAERWLILKALVAIAVVAGLIVVRQVFFV